MSKNNPIIRELAYQAIAKQSHKLFKYESRVVLDEDPEDLYQMRVGIRRLRSAIASFSAIVNLYQIAKYLLQIELAIAIEQTDVRKTQDRN